MQVSKVFNIPFSIHIMCIDLLMTLPFILPCEEKQARRNWKDDPFLSSMLYDDASTAIYFNAKWLRNCLTV